ncbi:MAG: hypothetical protein OXI22_00315 [Defluviicoccus sp.]|nr:hypothetical protein [Defluviicoccus sp.]MDE0382300.1 hypothetical protein [Defluviicoccus sp.]
MAVQAPQEAIYARFNLKLHRGLASEMATKCDMAIQAMGGRAMFQGLQSGAQDAGEFVGPWPIRRWAATRSPRTATGRGSAGTC